jgi:competence protein ComEC
MPSRVPNENVRGVYAIWAHSIMQIMSRVSVRFFFLLILIVGVGTIWFFALSSHPKNLTVAFLDIGQGDSIYIESPTGNQMLVDGGRDASVLQRLPQVMGVTDRSIDIVVATHPDADHIGGLHDVFERYAVSTYIDSGNKGDTATFRALEKEVTEEGASRILARRGMRIVLGGGAYADILFPDRDVSAFESNDASIVMRLVYGNSAFMLTGDARERTERILLSYRSKNLTSDVLKAGHHGSKTSSSEAFVSAVAPEYGIFSRGCDNTYGHPHASVVSRFTNHGVQILDTCTDGTVIFHSNGGTVSLQK